MIQRIFVGSLTAAIALFFWGCAAWMFLPTYTNFEDILDEEAVVRTLNESLPEKGVYYFPKHPTTAPEALTEWNEKVSVGPTGLVIFNPQGHGAVGIRKFAIAFVTQWVATFLAAVILWNTLGSHPTFRDRWLWMFFIGVIISVTAYLPNWNWYGFPGAFTWYLMRDMVLGWGIAAFFLAYFIKTKAEEKHEIKVEKELKKEIRQKLHTD